MFDIHVTSPSLQPYLKKMRTRPTELQRSKNLYHGPLAKLCIDEQQLLRVAGYSACSQEIVDSESTEHLDQREPSASKLYYTTKMKDTTFTSHEQEDFAVLPKVLFDSAFVPVVPCSGIECKEYRR